MAEMPSPIPRPVNENIKSEYIPDVPIRRPVNHSALADVELRADLEPAMITPLARLGYKLIEDGDADFMAFIENNRNRESGLIGKYIPDKKHVDFDKNKGQFLFSVIEDLKKQGIELDEENLKPLGIASFRTGSSRFPYQKDILTATHELGHLAFRYLKQKDLIPMTNSGKVDTGLSKKYRKVDDHQREESLMRAIDAVAMNKRKGQGIPSFKDMTNAGISNRPTNEARFINNVGKNNPVFQEAQKELNRLGVPPQAQYKEAPQPSIIERLFGRFLKEN